MALIDISLVTSAVLTVINDRLAASSLFTAAPTASPEPPTQVAEGLSFYLYHIQENAQYRNFPAPGAGQPAAAHHPIALNFYYQLSANSSRGALVEQQMMGVAIKALHDFAELDDQTIVNGLPIFDLSLHDQDNRFKILLQPIPYHEAVQYWTAGSAPVKLSVYYELSVVFLQPEPPGAYAGRVLQYGAFVFPEGAPRIMATENTVDFTLPDGTPRSLTIRPAQVAPGQDFQFIGANLIADRFDLFLNARGRSRLRAAPTWNLSVLGGDRIRATVQISAFDPAGNAAVVLPGLYGVQLNAHRQRTLPNGLSRNFESTSNQFPLTVAPSVETIVPAAAGAGGTVTVTGRTFEHPELREEDVVVAIGGVALPRDPALAAGTFRVVNDITIEVRLPNPLPNALPTGRPAPLQITVNGAESPPNWIAIL